MPLVDLDLGVRSEAGLNTLTASLGQRRTPNPALTGSETTMASEKGQGDGKGHSSDLLVPVFMIASVVVILG